MLSDSLNIIINGTVVSFSIISYAILLYSINFQLLQCQSRLVVAELLQQLEKIISSHAVLLELKISTIPLPIDELVIVAVDRLNLVPTPTLSPSLHYDWLMLLVISVELQLVEAT